MKLLYKWVYCLVFLLYTRSLLCCTGQWFKVLLLKEWSCFVGDGPYKLGYFRGLEKGFHTTHNSRDCAVICCWEMRLPAKGPKHSGMISWSPLFNIVFTINYLYCNWHEDSHSSTTLVWWLVFFPPLSYVCISNCLVLWSSPCDQNRISVLSIHWVSKT